MNWRTCCLLLALSLAYIPTAFADSLTDDLNQRYKNQVLALRAPFTHGDQIFDSKGQPRTRPEGPWLLYGGIYVRKMSLSSHVLRFEGPRVGFGGLESNGKPKLISLGKPVRVEIQLDHPLNSLDDAQVLLNGVFFLEDKDTDHAKPEFRRTDNSAADVPIYKANQDGTKFPRATYTPEPEFSEKARRAKFQGVVVLYIVVDANGRVARIRLERALGEGLDENAMEGVKNWRFIPATRNGQPVAIEMNIEVAFNLY